MTRFVFYEQIYTKRDTFFSLSLHLRKKKDMEAITLAFRRVEGFTDEEFYDFCMDNPELKFERTAKGEIIVMSNTGGITGDRNSEINFQLRAWNRTYKLGKVFDSSTAFRLPNGAVRSPDAAFVINSKWDTLTEEQKKKFPPVCPDFIIELKSESDTIADLRKKIVEDWLANGCQLAWLIDADEAKAYIFRPNSPEELHDDFSKSLFSELLPSFELDLNLLR
jgi:Uma2 family endonuclease